MVHPWLELAIVALQCHWDWVSLPETAMRQS